MKISVCIPTYNQGKYIEQCIRSVLNQTMFPSEIIISNDCSTDNTKEILYQLQSEIKILKVFHQDKNVGITKNVNSCLKKAQGDFIVRIDSDDLLQPYYLENLSSLLNKYPNAGYAHCAIQEIDQNGNYIKDRKLFRHLEFQTGKESLKSSLKGYKVAANILMFKREALLAVNYLQSSYNFAEDFYLATEIATKNWGNVYCDKILACYRVWVDAANTRNKRKLEEIKGMTAVYNDVLLPAFIERGWDVKKVAKAKKRLAINYADCLSWDVYSKQEKDILEKALLELSSTPTVKFTIYAYKKGLWFLFKQYNKIKKQLKSFFKTFLVFIYK
jgi:glycosyltransferase involved in cell wall biosynthesis